MSNLTGISVKVKYLFVIVIIFSGILLGTVTGQARESGEKIYVNKINISESRILTSSEISELSSDYQGKMVSVNELKKLIAEINELYSSKGYITARAILPEQKVKDGVVQIELVEGSIGEIVLTGNDNTRDIYFLNRIPFNQGDIIKLDYLEDELFYFNATSDTKLLADLKAGQSYGTTDLLLKVEEPPKYQGRVFADNAGRDETGIYRYGLSITDNSLTDYRDKLNLTLFAGEGLQAGTLSYSLPVYNHGTQLLLNYNKNMTDIISGEYESVDIEGDYEAYSFGFSHPFVVRPGFKVDVSLEYGNKVSDTYFSGVNLLTTGVETYNLGLTTLSINDNNTWYTDQNILTGLADSAKDDYDDPGTVGQFTKYRGYFQKQRKLKDNSIFTFKSYLQITDNKLLPSSEQFSLGGISTVRGYKEGKLSGDQGYFLSIELSKKVSDKTKFSLFLDHGGVYPYKGNEEEINKDDYLTSSGIGFTVNFTEKLSGKLILGIPFTPEEDPHIHFATQRRW